MKLLLVRHGETIDNERRVCQGHLPGKLNKKGVLQAELLARTLEDTTIDICYTSDLQRALETCDIITAPHPNLPKRKDERLRERNFGELQGTVMAGSWSGFAPIDGAEPMEKLYNRVSSFMETIIARHSANTVLIVSHGITLMTLTAICLGYSVSQVEHLDLPANCSLSCLEKDTAPHFRIVTHKEVSDAL